MNRTKLISTKTETKPFRHKFEIISPQIEPATKSRTVAIDQLLADLGCLGDRPTANAKVRVLYCPASLRKPSALKAVLSARVGASSLDGPMTNRIGASGHGWATRSPASYAQALIKHGWMRHDVEAEINLHDGDGSCHGYLIADFRTEQGPWHSHLSRMRALIYAAKSSGIEDQSCAS